VPREYSCAHNELAAHIISPEQYEFYDKWYSAAVRDILSLYPFEGNYRELAQLVDPPLSVREARSAIELLERLGLIRRGSRGVYMQANPIVRAQAQGYDVALARFAMGMMDRARDALDRLPKSERSISWVGFSVSRETYERMQEEILAFRSRMLKLAEQDPNPDRAYHFNMQLFPVSTPAAPNAPDSSAIADTIHCTVTPVTTRKGVGAEYRFNMGDGTISQWSADTAIAHVWRAPGSFAVRAQARSAVDTHVVSPWSDSVRVQVDTLAQVRDSLAPPMLSGPRDSIHAGPVHDRAASG
jgi:hypothetical protein